MIGFYLALHAALRAGLMGMPRRMEQYNDPTWQPCVRRLDGRGADPDRHRLPVMQLIASVRDRKLGPSHRRSYDGRTLEWATSSPPRRYNLPCCPKCATASRCST